MWVYLTRRLVTSFAVLIAISILVFALTNLARDPAIAVAGEGASASDIQQVRERYGFEQSLPQRYLQWATAAASGDLGISYRQNRPVLNIIVERLPVTLMLSSTGLVLALAISLPLSLLAARWPGSLLDRATLWLALVAQSVPSFWLALVLISLMSVKWGILPASGSVSIYHFIMPGIVLAIYAMPPLLRLTRAGLQEVLKSDYIRTARAKGLPERKVLSKHALRNALVPVVSIAAVQLGYMLGGSVLLETIFAMNGIGYLAWEAISGADLPVIQAIVLLSAFFYVALSLLADILNAWLDPRIRLA